MMVIQELYSFLPSRLDSHGVDSVLWGSPATAQDMEKRELLMAVGEQKASRSTNILYLLRLL